MRLPRLSLPALTPAHVAVGSMLLGIGLMIAGVYVLAGLGWALIAGAVPSLFLGGILTRGMLRVQ